MSASGSALTEDQQRELGSILWKYRTALDRVEFFLEAQSMFATSGRDDRLSIIADLLDETALVICELDLRREVLLHDRRTRSDVQVTPTLAEIAAAADEPWSTLFADHQRWFEKAVERIQRLVDESRHTLSGTLDLINQMVDREPGATITGYDRNGRTVRSSPPSILLDSRA